MGNVWLHFHQRYGRVAYTWEAVLDFRLVLVCLPGPILCKVSFCYHYFPFLIHSFFLYFYLIYLDFHNQGHLLRLFLPLPFHMPIPDCLLSFPIRISRFVSHVTFLSTITLLVIITCRRGPRPSLSRTLTHYAYLLIFLSPMSHTVLEPIVAGLSQALLVFNLS